MDVWCPRSFEVLLFISFCVLVLGLPKASTAFKQLCSCHFIAVHLQVQGIDGKLLLKKADCGHCIQQSQPTCMVKCLDWSKTFNEEDLKNVLQEPETLLKLIERAPDLASGFVKLATQVFGENLHQAAQMGHEKVAEVLLRAGAEVDAKDNRRNTALSLAAQMGHEKVVEVLLKAGAAINGGFGLPLHLAAQRGHEKVAEVLLRAGAEVNNDHHGATPLDVAVFSNHPKVVEMLLKAGAAVNAKNNQGATPLHVAAQTSHTKVVEVLLKARAEVNAKRSLTGTTPLHDAALYGDEKAVEVLLKARAEVNAKDKSGKTPLRLAAMNGKHKKVAEVLLKAGAVNGRDKVPEALRITKDAKVEKAPLMKGRDKVAEALRKLRKLKKGSRDGSLTESFWKSLF